VPNKPYCLYQPIKIFCIITCLLFAGGLSMAQFTVSGIVYDSSKIIPVKNVLVKSSSGNQVTTDSTGHYAIVATDTDSLTFIYNNKPTAKFAIKQVPDISNFNISLHVRVTEKFQTMKEVKVYSKNFRQDSIENRQYYNKIFSYQKPGVSTSINPGSGSVGMDLDEFINIFRFKRNRQLKKMQDRLLEQEQENYIKYRFNKTAVKRITRLEGADLDNFMALYKPDFEFTQMATTVEFYQYILNASYQYKKELLIKKNKTEQP
jgi:hypothetical protein